MKLLRNYFISGLLFWLPLVLTYSIVNFFIKATDNLIPENYTAESLIGFHIPSFIVISFIIFITGFLFTNFLGKYVLSIWDKFLNKIPIIRNIYGTIKKLSDTIFTTDSNNFKKVVLIEYPREGLWTFAFQTADYRSEIEKEIGEEVISIYMPTTPNPTSGFFLMLPKSKIKEVNVSVDEALKTIISMGIVEPSYKKNLKDKNEN
ncbi:Transporter [hydrothermal vent metagenome]|uniref:Transporter n=1 Tax=hydrothermal vent metagenome TaxID=652676 RepID=A0A1W1C7D9_9ZZZZ